MAFVNLPINKKKLRPQINKSKNKNLIHKLVYNTSRWRKLRIQILMNNPICEKCKNAFSLDVHHVLPMSIGNNEFQILSLGFDENNLMALCPDCHKEIHNEEKLKRYD